MTTRSTAHRRTVLTAALALTASAAAVPRGWAGGKSAARPRGTGTAPGADPRGSTVGYRGWSTWWDWRGGRLRGTRPTSGRRPALVIAEPLGTTVYTDPHTGTSARWEYAQWTSPVHRLSVPARELIASWNALTPRGTWLRIAMQGRYTDGAATPWYTLGIWASGDFDVRRTSVPGQGDGTGRVLTDTFAVDAAAAGRRLAAYRLRLTLLRTPGSGTTPAVRRIGAMTSDVPDRFEVPAVEPGPAAGVELPVPRYSQNVHTGRYPEYNGGGEAWCSPASTQMIVEYWGRRPAAGDLAWVDPEYDDPQVCHAARATFDHAYQGCGNWPFNTAYAATYRELQGVVTRLDSLADAERLVRAGIPPVTSQSFAEGELDGAGYGTAGHLMTLIGFTGDGDVIANDPAAPHNTGVRRIYPRRQWENIWLRTRRYDDRGEPASGTGGVCYLIFPARPTPRQRRALRSVGIR